MSLLDFVDWLAQSKEKGVFVSFVCCYWVVSMLHESLLCLLLGTSNTWFPIFLSKNYKKKDPNLTIIK